MVVFVALGLLALQNGIREHGTLDNALQNSVILGDIVQNPLFDTEENRPWPVAKLIDLAMVFQEFTEKAVLVVTHRLVER